MIFIGRQPRGSSNIFREPGPTAIHYAADSELELVGYKDSDWVGDSIDQKYTSRYVFMFGGGPIFWSRKKQSAIALSSEEGEYRGAVNACIQAVWLQGILSEFDFGSVCILSYFVTIKVLLRSPQIQFQEEDQTC